MSDAGSTEELFPIDYTTVVLFIMAFASLFYLALQKYYLQDLFGMLIILLQGIFVAMGLFMVMIYKHNDPSFMNHVKTSTPTSTSIGFFIGLFMGMGIMFLGGKLDILATGSMFSTVSGISFDATFSAPLMNLTQFSTFLSLSGEQIATISLTCFFVAISEEAMFRFTLPAFMHKLRGEEGYWTVSIFSLIIFGMYHAFVGGIMINLTQGMFHTILITILGLVFVILYYYTKSLLTCITFHFLYNFLIISGAIWVGVIFLVLSCIGMILYHYQKGREDQ